MAGFDHGGVGEILGELYPAGRVAPGDAGVLTTVLATLLDAAPPVPNRQPYQLATMRSATLAVYGEVAGKR